MEENKKVLTSKESDEYTRKLKEKFNTEDVRYLGRNRFGIHEYFDLTMDGTTLDKTKMVDEEGNIILLSDVYNSIFNFSGRVAVVCKGSKFTQDRKDGLIDENGNELLPCIYDSVSVHLDGHVDITKDGQKKFTTVPMITSGNFDWDEAIPSD